MSPKTQWCGFSFQINQHVEVWTALVVNPHISKGILRLGKFLVQGDYQLLMVLIQ